MVAWESFKKSWKKKKQREAKGKGEKGGWINLNVEFQRIPRRDKKSFLSDQCKEIEGKNRMGKTRDRFKKIRYPENISCEDGHNKEQDLTEAENIKKKWQENTELYKKDLYDLDNHDGMITHLEPDILECEVKWALESIIMNKASGVMEFQLSFFKSWKMMLLNYCT